MSLKFCPKCGSELESDSRYCVSCGADLGARKGISESTTTQTVPEKKVQSVVHEGVVYADFGSRLIAIIIDSIIISIIGSSLSWLFFFS